MINNNIRFRFLIVGLLITLLLIGCKKTRDFTYKHPKAPSRLLRVVLSLDSDDQFRLTIDGKLIAKKKFDLKPKGTKGWDMIGGFFETEHVNVSCIRDYVSIKSTSCDFNIETGPSVKVNFD